MAVSSKAATAGSHTVDGFSKSGVSARIGLSARELVKSTGSAVIYPDRGVIFQTSCSYCRLAFQDGDICRSTLCSHAFHASCMEDYFSRHRRCPVCRCKLGSRTSTPISSQRSSPAIPTPCWSPDYDSELMRISNVADQQYRDVMLSERGRALPPRSTLFLGGCTVLPIVREEDDHNNHHQHGPQWIVRDPDLSKWTPEMKRLIVAFVISLARMHVNQANCLQTAIEAWRQRKNCL